jgi:DNA-binding beta-propeller fold protein YncE
MNHLHSSREHRTESTRERSRILGRSTLASMAALTLAECSSAARPHEGIDGANTPLTLRPFELARSERGVAVARLDSRAWNAAASAAGPVRIEIFPLPPTLTATNVLSPSAGITLNLTRARSTSRGVHVVLARAGRAGEPPIVQEPLNFDADRIIMLTGTVEGMPGSRVFLSIAPKGSMARIDLGDGSFFMMSDSGGSRVTLASDELAIFPASNAGGVSLDVPLCGAERQIRASRDGQDHDGTDHDGTDHDGTDHDGTDHDGTDIRHGDGDDSDGNLPPAALRESVPLRDLRQIEVAVDTDYEYFELFSDADAAATYLIQLYGVISDYFVRDINARTDLVFFRLWSTPNDLFNGEDPLGELRSHWISQMQNVNRDVVQLLTGRRNLSAGGVAYLSGICKDSGYSWSGYTLGTFGDPDRPDWINRDIMIAAHELGHNFGTLHTHDYSLDDCDDALSQPRRGSIMSYCGQTYSGGDSNHDLWFHEVTAQAMRNVVYHAACVVKDCNGNRVGDSLDIAAGTSQDLNANGYPDECEDCNSNGTLDTVDIATGLSLDVNVNGLPDECEPDCNANTVPDRHDIQLGLSIDLNRNRIPDECEPDVNANGQADYNEIVANMPLDRDRDLVIDAFQDCDADGVTDHVELDHAWNLYVATTSPDASVREFYSATGVLMNTGSPGDVPDAQDLVITPDRRVLVSSASDDRIIELDRDGNVIRDLVPAGTPGFDSPSGLVLTDDGTLLVAVRGTSSVQEFSLITGARIRFVVTPFSNGLLQPTGLAIRGASLYVASAGNNRIKEFDLATGAFIRDFVGSANGGLNDPRGILFKPDAPASDGNLLVASRLGNAILEYDGVTGEFIKKWNRGGTSNRLTLDEPWGLRLGPDGDVYVSRNKVTREGHGGDADGETHTHDGNDTHIDGVINLHLTDARVYQFDVRNGNLVRAYVLGSDTGLYRPTGFDFMPGEFTDCNMNRLPDSCDIASGTSHDLNANGLPDECEPSCVADFDGTGFVDTEDYDAFVRAFEAADPTADVDGSGFVDTDDFDEFVRRYEAGC